MNWDSIDLRTAHVRYDFDPSLTEEDRVNLRTIGIGWAKSQCEAERKVFHECREENIWTAAYRCLDQQQVVNMCVASKLTQEKIREFEIQMIKRKEEAVQEKKDKERERQLDRQFVDFAHKFRQHKAALREKEHSDDIKTQ